MASEREQAILDMVERSYTPEFVQVMLSDYPKSDFAWTVEQRTARLRLEGALQQLVNALDAERCGECGPNTCRATDAARAALEGKDS